MKYPQLVSMPTEISDWLEEQLEARGIDAVVYTRYILSLLYSDPVDVACPDQDLLLTQSNKEVRRSASGRKRFRCFSGWRHYAQVDAEQLKRTAAIECLMSASDQNWEIESLVDQLCEKLKEIKNETKKSETISRKTPVLKNISPQDLANQYYAAFPSLIPETQNKLVSLIPKWFSSPKKQRQSKMDNSQGEREQNHDCYNWNVDNFSEMDRPNNAASFYSQEETINWQDEQQVPESEMLISNLLPDDFLNALDIPKHNLMQMTSSLIKEGVENVDEEENIIKAIWTGEDIGEDSKAEIKIYNKAVGGGPWEKLRSIWEYPTVDESQTPMDFDEEKKGTETNQNFENYLLNHTWCELEKVKKWSEAEYFEGEFHLDTLVRSIQLLNHNEKQSAFARVIPGVNRFKESPRPIVNATVNCSGDETEDLYVSPRTHFKPIGVPAESSDDEEEVRYPDGMTFPITGTLIKKKNLNNETVVDSSNAKRSLFKFEKYAKPHSSYVLKYIQDQNKRAETECDVNKKMENAKTKFSPEVPCQDHAMSELHNFIFSDEELGEEGNWKCTCPKFTNSATNMDFSTGNDLVFCPIHLKQSDKLAKIWNNGLDDCNKCKRNNESLEMRNDDSIWKFDPVQGQQVESICVVCSHINPDTPSPVLSNSEHLAMDDDDDQLFLDIFTLQKSYAEHLSAQVKYDISELCTNGNLVRQELGNANSQAISWSLATQMEHHRMMHMNSVPVLHSVTL